MSPTELTLFFDGRCPLCAAEMRRIGQLDKQGRLAFRDMSEAGFDAAIYGTTWEAMDAELHGVDRSGQMLVGIDCIAVVYSLIGRSWLVWPLKVEATKPFWRSIYRWFARNRYCASRVLGYRCENGVCAARRT